MTRPIIIRTHERVDYKRCPTKWYWHWRRGYVPVKPTYGAYAVGGWWHAGLATWYGLGYKRNGALVDRVLECMDADIHRMPLDTYNANQEQLTKHRIILSDMACAYTNTYGDDPDVCVKAMEIQLSYPMGSVYGRPVIYKLNLDLVFQDSNDDVWIMEHKSAANIPTSDHLPGDDQALAYASVGYECLRKAGIISPKQCFRGVTYNYSKKVPPDTRLQNAQGQRLNKDGSVSKRQAPVGNIRYPIPFIRKARERALRRIRHESMTLAELTWQARRGTLSADMLSKAPEFLCQRQCDYFAPCITEERGGSADDIFTTMYTRTDPYAYGDENARM